MLGPFPEQHVDRGEVFEGSWSEDGQEKSLKAFDQ
jgi:hypothetical protein